MKMNIRDRISARLEKILDVDDALTVGGIVMIGVGIWFFNWRVALIIMGTMCFSLGVLGARLRRRHGQNS